MRDARQISAREVSPGVQRHVLEPDDLVRQHGNGAQRRCSTGFRAPHRQVPSGGSWTKPEPDRGDGDGASPCSGLTNCRSTDTTLSVILLRDDPVPWLV